MTAHTEVLYAMEPSAVYVPGPYKMELQVDPVCVHALTLGHAHVLLYAGQWSRIIRLKYENNSYLVGSCYKVFKTVKYKAFRKRLTEVAVTVIYLVEKGNIPEFCSYWK